MIDPNFDIKENLKAFYNQGNSLIRIQLGVQFFTFSSEVIGIGKTIQLCEEVYEDETYRRKKEPILLKEIKIPSSLSVWGEIKAENEN